MYCHDKSYHSRKAIIAKCLPSTCHKVNMGGYASSQHLSNRRSTMVARLFTKLEWTSSSGSTTTRPNVYRCVPPRVGRSISIKGSSRPLESPNVTRALQLSRTDGCINGSKVIWAKYERKEYSNSIRQCDHSGIYQSSWRSQLRSHRYSKGYLERGIRASDLYFCKTPSRPAELPCRSVIKTIHQHEWQLHPKLFRLLDRIWDPHTIDRFATMNTTQLPKYNSRFLDPFSSGIDALTQQDWDMNNNFINASFRLIPKILSIIQLYKAEATIIAPQWPAQPWFQTLRSLSVAYPIPLPTSISAILSTGVTPEPCRNPKWKLYAWRISGKLAL